MARARAAFHVARCEDTVYVRVSGLATMHNAMTFRAFAERMAAEGFRRCLVDLAPCQGVDSTFMGVLVGLREHFGRERLVLLNPSPHCMDQMTSVGLNHLLTFADSPCALPADVELTPLPDSEVGTRERLELMRKAHRNLVAIDRRNRDKFGPFLDALDAQLGHGG
ncbi:MAG: anti-sigma factor antagonist [Planctomycetota bacterium]|nr:MAG: anti-sigma factor antagonist [Planctomycetota bacterium]